MSSIILYDQQAIREFHSLLQRKNYTKVFILVDQNTKLYCLTKLIGWLPFSLNYTSLEVTAGENHKNLETASRLWQDLQEADADRNSLLVNLGGGVICDLGGFVASTFKRGIDFVNIPTSLLSMVDAAIGGKTGINLLQSKNQVGTIANAKQILILPYFLQTLPKLQVASGFAEMLKHGLIWDSKHWEDLCKIQHLNSEQIKLQIPKSIQIKETISTQDPTEQGIRKILNFGHTVGHALESELLESNQAITHGHAVACGIMIECMLSENLGLLPKAQAHNIVLTLSKHYQFPLLNNQQKESLWQWMLKDKKNKNGQVHFALITKIGQAKYNIPAKKHEIGMAFKAVESLLNLPTH